jgi:membrane protein involved in colicin uptake
MEILLARLAAQQLRAQGSERQAAALERDAELKQREFERAGGQRRLEQLLGVKSRGGGSRSDGSGTGATGPTGATGNTGATGSTGTTGTTASGGGN